MKKFIAIAIVSFVVPGVAFAQSCVTSSSPGNGPPKTCLSGGVPQLSGMTGNMSVVRNGNVLQATDGMQLKAGDRLLSRGNDSGTIAMSGAQGGLCSVAVLANSSVTIAQSGGSTCLTQRTTIVSNPQPQVAAPSAPLPVAPAAPVASQGVSPLVLAIGGSALAGAAGIAISQSGSDKNRLSP
jgi:hypothetical protein